MNYKRAILFGIWLYLLSFVLFAILQFIPGIGAETYEASLSTYIVNWIAYIPITLLWAKWYFKKDEPTIKKGFFLGVISIVVAFVLDGVSVMGTLAVGESLEVFKALYFDWKFFVTILWVIVLCTFAGWEFDGTFTKSNDTD